MKHHDYVVGYDTVLKQRNKVVG